MFMSLQKIGYTRVIFQRTFLTFAIPVFPRPLSRHCGARRRSTGRDSCAGSRTGRPGTSRPASRIRRKWRSGGCCCRRCILEVKREESAEENTIYFHSKDVLMNAFITVFTNTVGGFTCGDVVAREDGSLLLQPQDLLEVEVVVVVHRERREFLAIPEVSHSDAAS